MHRHTQVYMFLLRKKKTLSSYVCMYATYICIYIHVHTHTGLGLCVAKQLAMAHVCMHEYIHAHIHAHTHIHTGLGLCVAKQLAMAHGGDITVQSELNMGSTFAIRYYICMSLCMYMNRWGTIHTCVSLCMHACIGGDITVQSELNMGSTFAIMYYIYMYVCVCVCICRRGHHCAERAQYGIHFCY